MRCNVAGLLKGPTGDTREMAFEDLLSIRLPDARLVEPVRGRAILTRVPFGVLVQAEASTMVAVQCARCLKPIVMDLDVTVTESFVPTVPIPGGPPVQIGEDSDPANWIDEKHILDLTEVLRQAIELAAPISPICRQDCLGLCAQCGGDRNEGPCECEPAPDPRWDDLRALVDADGP